MAELRGLDKAMKALRRLPEGIAEKGGGGPLRKGVAAGSRVFKREIEQRVSNLGPGVKNDRTGGLRLKDSIVARRDPNADEKGFTERYVIGAKAKVFWALFLERGTEKQPAQPFLAPSFDAGKDEVVSVFAQTMRKRIDALVKKAKR